MIGLGQALTLALASSRPGGFVGALDALIAQGATVRRAYSVRRLKTGYAGKCAQLRGNGTGTPVADIPFTGGALDKGAVAALIASGSGTAAYWKTFYDQSGNGSNATQTTAANQVVYGEGVFATGALGALNAAQTNCWLDFLAGAAQPCAIWVVCSFAATAANRNLVGGSASTAFGLSELGNTRFLAQHYGTLQSSGYPPTGLVNVLGVANGAASTLWVGGNLVGIGNAGAVGLGGMRIGAGGLPTTGNWFGATNNTITEVILFGGDPTGLAGWPAFVAEAKSYFGTA